MRCARFFSPSSRNWMESDIWVSSQADPSGRKVPPWSEDRLIEADVPTFGQTPLDPGCRSTLGARVQLALAGVRVEHQALGRTVPALEVEHGGDASRGGVHRSGDAAQVPVVLDEAEDGGLVGESVVDGVGPGPGGDDEQRQARPEA